jgi:hypothetical protein
MPVTHPQYRSHDVYSRNFQQESEDNYIDPEVYQSKQSTHYNKPLANKRRSSQASIPRHLRSATPIIPDSYTEDAQDEYLSRFHDINPNRLVTEEPFLQFAEEFEKSLINNTINWNNGTINDYEEKEKTLPKKHLNFKGLILQAKSQSKQ